MTRSKRNLILTRRDIEALQQLLLHRAMSSSQFAALCFHNCGYETARKRVRKLIKHGYLGITNRRRCEGRGRPEQLYFVTDAGIGSLKQMLGIDGEPVPSGVPHPYLKEHCLSTAQVHLSLRKAEQAGVIHSLKWTAGWQLAVRDNGNQTDKPDAIVNFELKEERAHRKKITAAIIIDTGNLRQTRHWEPKLNFLLQEVPQVWIITGNTARILTLRKWTQPIVEAYDAQPDHCVFSVYEDLTGNGIFNAQWVDVHGNAVRLLPQLQGALL